jgi:2-hydroxychromene-2-carboxylate isomerase
MTRAFYFDVGSPYVYLTISRLPLDDVEWKPISLGGLWKQSGGGSWALTDRRAEGIAKIEARAGLLSPSLDRIGSSEIKQRLLDETEAAYARGVRGVPTLDTGDELLWGDDRIS